MRPLRIEGLPGPPGTVGTAVQVVAQSYVAVSSDPHEAADTLR